MRGGFGITAAAGVSGHSEAGEEEAEASAVFCAAEPALLRGRPRPQPCSSPWCVPASLGRGLLAVLLPLTWVLLDELDGISLSLELCLENLLLLILCFQEHVIAEVSDQHL